MWVAGCINLIRIFKLSESISLICLLWVHVFILIRQVQLHNPPTRPPTSRPSCWYPINDSLPVELEPRVTRPANLHFTTLAKIQFHLTGDRFLFILSFGFKEGKIQFHVQQERKHCQTEIVFCLLISGTHCTEFICNLKSFFMENLHILQQIHYFWFAAARFRHMSFLRHICTFAQIACMCRS